ncbi:MAG: DUF1456 family protein [Oceanospirillaceae bacterium]
MTNNDVLRRMRYVFDLSDSKMIAIFAMANLETTREEISQWLKKDEDADYLKCKDVALAAFLNGFIVEKRGKKEGAEVENEKRLTNNIVFRKVKIALNLQSDDIIELFNLVELPISKHELSAFFRKADHKNYRECKDQVLRNFLHGLQLRHRADDKDAAQFS